MNLDSSKEVTLFAVWKLTEDVKTYEYKIDNSLIKKMIKHPDPFLAIIHHKQLILYNIIFYLLGVFPKNLTVHLIYKICKKRGYFKPYYQ